MIINAFLKGAFIRRYVKADGGFPLYFIYTVRLFKICTRTFSPPFDSLYYSTVGLLLIVQCLLRNKSALIFYKGKLSTVHRSLIASHELIWLLLQLFFRLYFRTIINYSVVTFLSFKNEKNKLFSTGSSIDDTLHVNENFG